MSRKIYEIYHTSKQYTHMDTQMLLSCKNRLYEEEIKCIKIESKLI